MVSIRHMVHWQVHNKKLLYCCKSKAWMCRSVCIIVKYLAGMWLAFRAMPLRSMDYQKEMNLVDIRLAAIPSVLVCSSHGRCSLWRCEGIHNPTTSALTTKKCPSLPATFQRPSSMASRGFNAESPKNFTSPGILPLITTGFKTRSARMALPAQPSKATFCLVS